MIPWNLRHDLGARLRDDDILLDPHTTEAAELVDAISHKEPAELGIGQGLIEQMADEVATWLYGQHHVGLEDASRPQVAEADAFKALGMSFQVASNIVNVLCRKIKLDV